MDIFLRSLMQGIAHTAKRERNAGRPGRANGIMWVGLGFVLLPIPIIGFPLMIYGAFKIFRDK